MRLGCILHLIGGLATAECAKAGANNEHRKADPYPADERVHAHVHRQLAGIVHAAVHHEQVFHGKADHARIELGLLRSRLKRHRRRHGVNVAAGICVVHLKLGTIIDLLAVRGLVHFVVRIAKLVVFNRERATRVGILVEIDIADLLGHIHRRANEAHQNDGHREVRDVAAKTRGVSREAREKCRHRVFARGLCASANRAANKEQRVEEQQARHGEAHHGDAVVVPHGAFRGEFFSLGAARLNNGVIRRVERGREIRHKPDEQHNRAQCGNARLLPERLGVGFHPRKQRAHSDNRAVHHAKRARDGVVRAGRQALAAKRQPRRQRACHREVAQNHREHDHDHVVEVIRGVTRGERFHNVVLAGTEAFPANEQANNTHKHRDRDKAAEKHERHGVALKGVHRLHDARARDERAGNDERKRDARAHNRPALKRAALAIHGEAVHKRERHAPRKQAGVFHGIPAPVAAPAEHDVGPYAAKANANAQEQPRNHSETARALNPFLRGVVHDERRNSVCKRNGKARIADEQRRRVNGLRPVLKQWVHALHGARVREAARGIDIRRGGRSEGHVAFREEHNRHKSHEHEARHEQRHAIDGLVVLHHAHGHGHIESRNEPRPQQKRAFAAGPQARKAIEHAERAFRLRMLEQHVFDREVARHEAEDE